SPDDLGDAYLFIRSVHGAQGVADFSYCGVYADAIDQERHGVGIADATVITDHGLLSGGVLEGFQAALDFLVVAAGAQGLELFGLVAANALIDVEDFRLFLFDVEVVGAYDDLFVGFDGALVLVRGFGNLFLRIAVLDGAHHAAESVKFLEVVERALFHIDRQLFEEVGSAEGIDGLRDAGFVGNDLLRTQGDAGGFGGGQSQGFVVRIGMERLRSAQHRGHGLDGHAGDVV